MATIKYTDIQQMEPRPGRPAGTQYLKQRGQDQQELDQMVRDFSECYYEYTELHPELIDWAQQPNRNLTRHEQQGAHYSVEESIVDMLTVQLELKRPRDPSRGHKDYPVAKIQRWNRAWDEFVKKIDQQDCYRSVFEQAEIELVQQDQERVRQFENLFE